MSDETRPPLPPFTEEVVSLAHTEGSAWRNRDEFFEGRDASMNDYEIEDSERKFRPSR